MKIVIDHQNLHLTGHGRFVPEGVPRHESLVHPLYFANQWLTVRNRMLATRATAGQGPQLQYILDATLSSAAYRPTGRTRTGTVGISPSSLSGLAIRASASTSAL